MREITQYLIDSFQFTRILEIKRSENVDIDKFTCYKRISEVIYLFYSESLKHFDIAYKYEKPKGAAGGGFKTYKNVMIPRPINNTNDVDMLMLGITGETA